MKLSPGALRRLLPLVFAAAMGLVAVVLVHQHLSRQQRALELERKRLMADYQEPIEVVVAARDLEPATVLEPAHLTMARVPEKFVQPYASGSPQGLLGMVTLVPLAEGEQVLLNKVRRPEEVPTGSTLSALTPKGKRAVTIAVDTITGVGGFVRPGDAVDVLWTFKLPAASQQESQVVTLTLFQDVPVLAVGQELTEAAKRPVAKQEEAGQTVTLALSPQETAFLLFAREQGRIQLSLRSSFDRGSQTAVAPANINTLMDAQLGVQRAPAATHRVEVYKGLKRDIVVLSEQQE